MAAGQKVPITVSGASDRTLTGIIRHVAVAANPSTKTYLVKVALPSPDRTLKPGMFAGVSPRRPGGRGHHQEPRV